MDGLKYENYYRVEFQMIENFHFTEDQNLSKNLQKIKNISTLFKTFDLLTKFSLWTLIRA